MSKQAEWQRTHRSKCREYNRKYLLSKPILCRHCGEHIPNEQRKSGVVFCSDDCRKKQRLETARQFRSRYSAAFLYFKESIGCRVCGYNNYGGALDFHHLESKSFRIDARRWWSNSPAVQAEMQKCLLLCKNCHYELDKKRKENGDVY